MCSHCGITVEIHAREMSATKNNHMTAAKPEEAILLLSCRDRKGLVSSISDFISRHNGNIIDLDEHVDPEEGMFFIRVAWDMGLFTLPKDQVEGAFAPLAAEFDASWKIRFSGTRMNIAIFVSKYDHCLQELLWRQRLGEFPVRISMIISNHSDLEPLAKQYGIPFFHFPISPENRHDQEEKEIRLLQESQVETIVLARYMQVLSSSFVARYPERIINIHHSFLPAFVGGNPYKQAYERGVKIIGATSHYVTWEIDEGPIIEQDITPISHKDTVQDLIRKGRDLERIVLARALRYHSEHRILTHGNRTIVFD